MQSCGRCLTALAGLGAMLLSCEPNLGRDEPVTGIRPVFSPEKGQIPLPSDLLRDATTGRLVLPEAADDSPLTKEIKASIGRLDGWLSSSTVTIPFDVMLDTSTLTYDNVLLYDLSRANETPPVVKKLGPNDYWVVFNVGLRPATIPPFNVILKRKPKVPNTPLEPPVEFKQGGRYAAIVTDSVRDVEKRTFLDNPIFYLLRSRTPLAANGKTLTVLPDKDATQLEPTRAVYNQAFSAIEAADGFDRSHALAFTVFSIESGPRAIFDPSILGDAAKNPIPKDGAGDVSLDSKLIVKFDLPLNPSTVAAGTHLFRVENFEQRELAEEPVGAEVDSSPDATGLYKLTITPTTQLHPDARYVAVVTDAIKGSNGTATEAFSLFSLARNKNPLLDSSKAPNSPLIDNTLDALVTFAKDPVTATGADWIEAYGNLTDNLDSLEKLRVRLAPYFDAVEKKGIERLSVSALWQFTTGKSGVQ